MIEKRIFNSLQITGASWQNQVGRKGVEGPSQRGGAWFPEHDRKDVNDSICKFIIEYRGSLFMYKYNGGFYVEVMD